MWFPSKVVAVVEVEHDDQEIIQRVAALDIGKTELVCCVRLPGPGRRRLQEVRTFSTMTRSLLAMSNWLTGLGVSRVVMEATGDYWKPPFYLLEGSFETWLGAGRGRCRAAASELACGWPARTARARTWTSPGSAGRA